MENAVLQLGVGGIFVLLVLREISGILRGRRTGARTADIDIKCPNKINHVASTLLAIDNRSARIEDQMEELHRWHRPNDDGKQNWKWSSSIEEKFQKLLDSSERISVLIEKLTVQNGGQEDSLKAMTRALIRAIDGKNEE